KRAEEAAFAKWINESPDRQKKYGEVLPSLEKAYAELTKTAQRDLLVQQFASLSDVFEVLSLLKRVAAEKEKPQSDRNPNLMMTVLRARGALPEIFAERNGAVERAMFIFLLRKAAELPAGQKIDAVEKRFGNLQGDARIRAEEDFARAFTEGKNFATAEAVTALFEKTSAQLKELNEPIIDFAGEIGELAAQVGASQRAFNARFSRWKPLLVQGMSEMHGSRRYSGANRTLSLRYVGVT